ncbi:MAG: ABC transporter permease DevC [Cyanobacteria bacterium P01_F01_bin.153]
MKLVATLKGLQKRTPLGVLQLRADLGRLAVAVAGIVFADVLMLIQLGFSAALYDSNTRLHDAIEADAVILSRQGDNLVDPRTFPRRRLFQALAVTGVADATPMNVSVTSWATPEGSGKAKVMVIGVDPHRVPLALPGLSDSEKTQLKLNDRLIFDRQSRGDYGNALALLDQGKTVRTELNDHEVEVVGTYTVGASFAANGSVLVSDRTFERLFPGRSPTASNLGLIQFHPDADPEATLARLKDQLPDDIYVFSKTEFIEFEKNYWQSNTAVGFIFTLGTVMGFVVGAVIVYQILATDAKDHLPEYATLKAMGFRHRYLLGVVMEEAIVLTAIGFFPGLLASMGLYSLTRRATSLPITLTASRAVLVLILTAIMCLISGAIAARQLESADPADLF